MTANITLYFSKQLLITEHYCEQSTLLAKNYQSTSKINNKGSNSCLLATLQPIHQILTHIASGSFPFFTQFLNELGLKSVLHNRPLALRKVTLLY